MSARIAARMLLAFASMWLPAIGPTLSHALRSETQTYVEVVRGLSFYDYQGLGGPLICDAAGTQIHVGGGCFALDGTERTVELVTRDDLLGPPALEVWFVASVGELPIDGMGHIACSGDRLTIPPGAAHVIAHMQDDFPECPGSARATTGRITASFFA